MVGHERALAQKHLIPHFTQAGVWESVDLPVIVRGQGCYLYDSVGDRYLDGLSGLFCTNLGHGRKDLADAAARQLGILPYWTNWGAAHPAAVEAATHIADVAPDDLNMTFFVNSGSEANESAIKFVRQYHRSQGQPHRTKIIARNMAYHGTTLGALALTGLPKYKEAFGPLMPGVRHVPNTLGELGLEVPGADDLPSVQAIRAAIEEEGADTIAAIIVEPVQSSRGALVPPPGYAGALRAICDAHGILLIADEVICGFGRMGDWFGSSRYGFEPDLMTFAKGVTAGYAPLGGVIVRERLVRDLMDSPAGGMFTHGATWGGHPLSTAVASATIQALHDEEIPANVRRLEDQFQKGLTEIVEAHDCLREWRGTGFLYALEFVRSRSDRVELTPEESAEILGTVIPEAMRRTRLITRPDNRGAIMLILAPPLIADQEVLAELLSSVDAITETVEKYLHGRNKH